MVGRLAHIVCSIDEDLFPLDLPVDLVDKVIVIHFDGLYASPGGQGEVKGMQEGGPF